jgi:hypothetical protein
MLVSVVLFFEYLNVSTSLRCTQFIVITLDCGLCLKNGRSSMTPTKCGATSVLPGQSDDVTQALLMALA